MPPGIYNAKGTGFWNALGGSIVTNANMLQGSIAHVNLPTSFPVTASGTLMDNSYEFRYNNVYRYYNNVYQSAPWNGIYSYNFDETPEQRVARETADVKWRQTQAVAESRAEQLLFTMLSEAQAKQYIEHGYFETKVNDKTYRIRKGRAGNVELIENGSPKFRYCAHPNDMTPAPDAMIAQLLMLKTNEQRFLSIANRTVLRG